MPVSITARVEEALAALHRHPERALLPWYRYAIYTALTPGNHSDGRAARAWLDVIAVQHVLFCWQPDTRDSWPDTWLQPDQLLVLAEQLMRGSVDREPVRKAISRAQAIADIVLEDATSPRYCGWCVYEAALRALSSAWAWAQPCDEHARDIPLSDITGCADDASSYAAIAVAGGTWHPIREPAASHGRAVGRWDVQTADARLRRAVFWEWWLRDAIPSAWRMRA